MLILLLFVGLNLITFTVYYIDKNAAINNRQRIPESTLLTLGLIGGWPAALLAQQIFRHKTRKTKFQLLFWMTVLANALLIYWLIETYFH
jgi:uncharacterized membrane protein YsdA (DUF1294 family)